MKRPAGCEERRIVRGECSVELFIHSAAFGQFLSERERESIMQFLGGWMSLLKRV